MAYHSNLTTPALSEIEDKNNTKNWLKMYTYIKRSIMTTKQPTSTYLKQNKIMWISFVYIIEWIYQIVMRVNAVKLSECSLKIAYPCGRKFCSLIFLISILSLSLLQYIVTKPAKLLLTLFL